MPMFNGRPVGTIIRAGGDTTYFVRQPGGKRVAKHVPFPRYGRNNLGIRGW